MQNSNVDFLCEFKDPSSRSVNIVFSEFLPEDRGARSFSFRHMLGNMKANIIYVKDRKNQWYNKGSVGLGEDIASVSSSLKALIENHNFNDIRCLGTSMGGYASLLFGRELGASSILAMAPQTFLAKPYPRFSDKLHDGEYVDLSSFDSLPATRTTVVIGEDELFDLYSVFRLSYWREIDLKIIKGATHLVARALNDADLFREMLRKFVEEGEYLDLSSLTIGRELEGLRDDLMVATEGMHHQNMDGRVVTALQSLLQQAPSWAGVHYWLGRALNSELKRDDAAVSLARALDLNPTLYQAASDLSQVRVDQGDWLGGLRSAIAAWQLNQHFTGVRDRAVTAALDALENGIGNPHQEDSNLLLAELEKLFSHEKLAEHPEKERAMRLF